MEFRVVDFEKLTKHYKNYQDGVEKINEYKEGILKRVEPIRNEMQKIISAAQSGIVVDNLSEEQRMKKFQSLQNELLSIDKEAKVEITKMRDELNEVVYDELKSIINVWSIKMNIDIVIGKMEVVYVKDNWESTESILDILKQRDLFVEEIEKIEEVS
jgi:Skp family chaperone for outer membrane proteins